MLRSLRLGPPEQTSDLVTIQGFEPGALRPAARRRARTWVVQLPWFPMAPGLPPSAADFR